MARKKVKLESNIKTLDDANEALRRIGELEAGIDAVVGKYNAAEARRRKAVDEKVNPLREEIKRLERELKLYAQAHKEEFGKKRSVKLPNGSIGFRIGQYAVKALKRLKAIRCSPLFRKAALPNVSCVKNRIWIRSKLSRIIRSAGSVTKTWNRWELRSSRTRRSGTR